jgi:exosome complex component RRP41
MASQHGAVSQEKCIVDVEYSRAAFASAERKRRARGKKYLHIFFEFSNKKITGDKKAQEISLSLKKTFEATILTTLYPRSAISIFVEVLQADGGDYAVCVNAATLALIDAGIPIRDVCCAVSCGVAIKDNVAYSLLDLGRF